MRQVASDDGKLRPDFVVRVGDASVVIDAKFALDEDLAGVDEAIDADDPERLVGYGRKLRARAEDLAKRDYAKVADRGKAIVLLYVPVEGAYEALRVLPNFSIEKFSQRHRVYVVTPSQLGLALGFVAEVAHDARRSEETERVATTLLDAAEDMANMVDQLDQHGKHLQTAFTSYDKLVGMTGTRGNLWRRMSSVFEFARRSPSTDGEVRQINPPREDAGEIAERWREAAGDSRGRVPARFDGRSVRHHGRRGSIAGQPSRRPAAQGSRTSFWDEARYGPTRSLAAWSRGCRRR